MPEAIARESGEFVKITLVGEGRPLVLKRSKIEEANDRINGEYGVREASYIE